MRRIFIDSCCEILYSAKVNIVHIYNESYGLGKDGIRREKAGRYEN